jgi:hypothetical protein
LICQAAQFAKHTRALIEIAQDHDVQLRIVGVVWP